MIVAECVHCGGRWGVFTTQKPERLEGACGDCQRDSDTEKPLKFYRGSPADRIFMGELPEAWLS